MHSITGRCLKYKKVSQDYNSLQSIEIDHQLEGVEKR